jgi:uncharacterized membrane protein YhaH (DUF805 family)
VLKKYAVFNGRAGRKEYWIFNIINFIIIVFYTIAADMIVSIIKSPFLFKVLSEIENIYYLAILIPFLAVSTRRLHDTNHSGWWLIAFFTPLISRYLLWFIPNLGLFTLTIMSLISFVLFIIFLIFMLSSSQPNENKYGPNPNLNKTNSNIPQISSNN